MLKTLSFLAILICLTAALITACTKRISDNHQIPEPLQKYIQTDTFCACHPWIDKFFWKGKIVYMHGYSGTATLFCDYIPTYFDADGYPFTLPGGYTPNQFFEDAKRIETIWHCER